MTRMATISLLILARVASADPIKVTVDFSGAPSLTAADKTAILDKMKAKYTGLDVEISEAAGGKLTVKFNDTEGDGEWGDSDKKGHFCKMNVLRWKKGDRKDTFNTGEKRRNLWAETGAHELGHLLCAVHNKDDPPSLMTKGDMVSWDQRAADGRSFTDKDKENIKKGIKMLGEGKSWDLDAEYDEDDVCCVPGRQLDPEAFERDDAGISFEIQVNPPSLGLGFINDVGEYVEIKPPGPPVAVFEWDGGAFGNFAIMMGTSIIQFDLDAPGALRTPMLPMPHTTAMPGGWGPYFQRVVMNFGSPAISVMVAIDASGFYSTGGFSFQPPCMPDCEGDGDLDVFDFLCFQALFAAQNEYADFEEDYDHDVFDFLAFLNAFGHGC